MRECQSESAHRKRAQKSQPEIPAAAVREVHAEREKGAPTCHRAIDRADQCAILAVVLRESGTSQRAREYPTAPPRTPPVAMSAG
jgi:hypothetical protein